MKKHTSTDYDSIVGDQNQIFHYTHHVNKSAHSRRQWTGQEIGTIPAVDLHLKMEHQNWECIYCGEKLTFAICELDHIYPLSRGGDHYLYNVAFACKVCNQSKKSKTLKTFCKLRGYDIDEIRQRMADINQQLHDLLFKD